MKIEPHILYFNHIEEAERIEGSVFGSMEEVKGQLVNDGAVLADSQHINEYPEDWNIQGSESDPGDVEFRLNRYFIAYIYIIKRT